MSAAFSLFSIPAFTCLSSQQCPAEAALDAIGPIVSYANNSPTNRDTDGGGKPSPSDRQGEEAARSEHSWFVDCPSPTTLARDMKLPLVHVLELDTAEQMVEDPPPAEVLRTFGSSPVDHRSSVSMLASTGLLRS